ncbi:uncharacterized protein [Haliotis cracherodii]|uniref:uncharacterized protein n=1 Tax=Haliotis cracherodii TaxID=6455 RepID=UPI0039EC7A67
MAFHKSVITRIDNLKNTFVQIDQLETAEDLLERYDHAANCGAPGDGKTSIALMLCEKYLRKHYEVLFIEHIEQFDVNVIIKRHNHIFIVFDDIFGSVTFPTNLENTQKVFSALEEALQIDILEKECKTRSNQGRRQAKPDQDESQPSEKESQQTFKLCFLFTSRTYNWNEGRARLHQFKVNLFNLHRVIDLSKKCLTDDEKETILRSHMRRYPMCYISEEDVKTIAHLQTKMFGYPLICSLYTSNPDFHVLSPEDFFQNPVTHLRGHLDTIVREHSCRSAALILLFLCEGKLDLVSLQLGKGETDMFQVVKEVVPSCTPTEIGNEIGNLTGTYCTVEKNMAFFSHPSIYDATACAFGNYNPILLLKHCSLKFLYERVKREKRGQQQLAITNDVTNLTHLSPGLYPLVLTRLVEGIRQGYFKWTLKHPIFNNDDISSSFANDLSDNLPQIIQQEDKVFGECYLNWVSQSDNHALFEQSLEMLGKKEIGMALSHRSITDLRSGIVACVQHGRLSYLKQIITELNAGEAFDVNMTKGDKSLHMIAAESGHLDVFRFLLEEGPDIKLADSKGYTCLHHSCKSGSTDITKVIAEGVPEGADLSLTDAENSDCLMLARKGGNMSIVRHLLSLKTFDINRKGGSGMQTPVMLAAEGGHYEVYNRLVSEGADLSLTDEEDSAVWRKDVLFPKT